jgi:hypothetical protein
MRLSRLGRGARIRIEYSDGRRIVLSKRQAEKMLRDERKELEDKKKEMVAHLKTQNVVTTAHEGTHQLIDASGLFPFMDDAPLWLNEGLATFIEASYRGRWVGVGTINKARLKTFKSAARGDGGMSLHPLEDMIQKPSLLKSGTRGSILVAYSEVWSLVYYLTKTRREDFVSYLDYIQKQPKQSFENEEARGRRNLKEFKRFFGEDIAAFEAEWIDYITNLH